MSEKLSFEEIAARCDLSSLSPSVEQIQDVNGDMLISADEQRRELEKIARLISRGHPGYKTWDKETIEKFEQKIADLYNGISGPKKLKTKGEEGQEQEKGFYNLVDEALQILPDEHLKVSPGKGNLIPRQPKKVSVGENSCPEEKLWEIKQSEDGKSTILAIRDLGSAEPGDWLKLQKEVRDALFNEDGTEKCGSLVIDVRSNPGGPTIPYELIGQMLYGNEVAHFEKMAYRDTPENDFLRLVNGEMTREEYNQRLKEHKYTDEMITAVDYSGHEQEFPPFAKGGFRKPIVLLTNRETASAGESLRQYLNGHPGLTVVGENTAGCHSEISGESPRNQFGYGVKIATGHAYPRKTEETKKDSYEKTGYPVDIKTEGQDALAYTLGHLEEITAKAQEKLDSYTPPQMANNRDDRLAFNDFMFIRAINTNLMSVEDVRNAYNALYPGKAERFDKIIVPAAAKIPEVKGKESVAEETKSQKKGLTNSINQFRETAPASKTPTIRALKDFENDNKKSQISNIRSLKDDKSYS
ncbi:MAG: hypothetical protein J5787_08680 [Alphaproteobacteria bacterium]|nr:hypothetical protein [Alphaproteobacteria bacterium]